MAESIISKGLIDKFDEYLEDLIKELNSYSSEDKIWQIEAGISNSAGNLTTHLIGNLNHFIGAVLGNTGYIRNRPLEFSVKDKPLAELISEIEAIGVLIPETLNKLSDSDYKNVYPFTFKKSEFKPNTFEWMIQIVTHLAYHVGQIHYHRRLI